MFSHPGISFEKLTPIFTTAKTIAMMVAFFTDPLIFKNLIVIEPINKPTKIYE